jgi:hypothetical protein
MLSSCNFFRGEAAVEVFEIGEDDIDSSFAYGPLLKRLIAEGGTRSGD